MKQKKGMELVTERTVDGFRRELLRREYSHGTAESYVRSIRAFARWSGGAVDRGLLAERQRSIGVGTYRLGCLW